MSSALQEDGRSDVDPEEEAGRPQGTTSALTSSSYRHLWSVRPRSPPRLSVFQGPEMTKVIRSYNKMAAALLQYELLHLQGWSQAAESAPHRLTAALLVRHQNSKVLHDVMILQRCDPAAGQ